MADEQQLREEPIPEHIMRIARQQFNLSDGERVFKGSAPEHMLRTLRQQDMERIAASMQPQGQGQGRGQATGSQPEPYDDLPIKEPDDLGYIGQKPSYVVSYELACQDGSLSTVQSILSETRTPVFLHRGLVIALRAGNVEIASCLLSAGAPIVRKTPEYILSAPVDKQIPLFELFIQHGWTPNTPGYYGAVLLPRVVTNPPLLRWFLDHGANPNLGAQRYYEDRFGGPITDSCAALEAASSEGNLEAVRMLLDAGARISNGAPLHAAAGALPPGTNPHTGRVIPTKEFDISRIPVMELLVKRGADVNQPEISRHMVPKYAIVSAVMAGAVERVKWLLEHGADPEAKGGFGNALSWVHGLSSEEMRQVVEEGVAARRWVKVP